MVSNFINIITLLTSLVTAGSVFLHDTRIDKAAMVTAPLPRATVMYEEQGNKQLSFGDAHTHVEKVSFSQMVNDFGSSPRVHVRNDDKKHLLQNRVGKGHHAFDNYNLPLI